MKILILGANQGGRYNWGHQLFKNEVARQHNVRFYGEGYKDWRPERTDIRAIMSVLGFRPDVILSYMGKYCKWVKGMEKIDIPKAHIAIDYFPWNYAEEDTYIRATNQDLVFAPCRHEVVSLKRNGHTASVRWLPFSVDTGVFRYNNELKNIDASAVFSVVQWCYPTRSAIIECLQKMNGGIYSIKAQASWPASRVLHSEYVSMLASSKIAVNGVDVHRSLNWKFLEGCACGAMLVTEKAEDAEALGFVDGFNCVMFEGLDSLRALLKMYLRDNDARQKIAAAGYLLVRSRHSNAERVGEMTRVLKAVFGSVCDDVA